MLRALIFDVDGTLADTEELHRQAFNAAFMEMALGWEWTRASGCFRSFGQWAFQF